MKNQIIVSCQYSHLGFTVKPKKINIRRRSSVYKNKKQKHVSDQTLYDKLERFEELLAKLEMLLQVQKLKNEEHALKKMRFAASTQSVKSSPRIKSKFQDNMDSSSIASRTDLSSKGEESIDGLLKHIQDVAKDSNLFELVYISSRMRGDFYIEEKQFNKAFSVYNFLRLY